MGVRPTGWIPYMEPYDPVHGSLMVSEPVWPMLCKNPEPGVLHIAQRADTICTACWASLDWACTLALVFTDGLGPNLNWPRATAQAHLAGHCMQHMPMPAPWAMGSAHTVHGSQAPQALEWLMRIARGTGDQHIEHTACSTPPDRPCVLAPAWSHLACNSPSCSL